MKFNIYFRYRKEQLSFYNVWLTFVTSLFLFGSIINLVIIGISGVFVLLLSVVIEVALFVNTLRIKKEYKLFETDGEQYKGEIVAYFRTRKKRGSHDYVIYQKNIQPDKISASKRIQNRYSRTILIRFYDKKIDQNVLFESEAVTTTPFYRLTSLEVTVYVLRNGRMLATDFQRVKKNELSVAKKNPEIILNKVFQTKEEKEKFILKKDAEIN